MFNEGIISKESQLKVSELYKEITLRDEENGLLNKKINSLEEANTKLTNLLIELRRDKFGKRSERWECPEQLCLFNEAEVEVKKSEEEESKVEVKGHTKKRGKRKPLPKDLPRKVVMIELPEDQRFTEDGIPLKIIGYEISEKLEYEPAKMRVIEYRRAKYGVDLGDYNKTAPSVPSIIPKGIATPSLLSGICVSKFADGLPLYRQEEIFARSEVDLPRSSMSRWVVQTGNALQPIWNILSERQLGKDYLSCDETRTQVLKEKGRKAESQSWMWVRSTPFGKHKIVLFDYKTSRSQDTAYDILEGFQGYLQVDGYRGYNKITKVQGVIEIGCNMHGRRYFEKASKIGANSGKTLSEKGLMFYQQLYQIEDEIRTKTPQERFEIRLKKAQPIWGQFKIWVLENKSKVPPSSKIGKAFGYFESEFEFLKGYLKDGRLEMDSGFVERCIRKYAIGRNNWLFSDTPKGAQASANIYSCVVTAKVNLVNPYEALKYVLHMIPKIQSIDDFEKLADIFTGAEPIPEYDPYL